MAVTDNNGTAAQQDQAEPKLKKPWPRWAKRLRTLVIVLVIAAGAFFGYRYWQSSQEAEDAGFDVYAYGTVMRQDIVESLSYTGTLQPADAYTVTSLVKGEILTAGFQEGDIVKKDDVLYTVDSKDAQNEVTRAQNALESARRAYETAQRGLDVAQRGYTTAQRGLGVAQRDLSDLKISAPAAGRVVDIKMEVGDSVTVGQQVAVVRDTSVMTLKIPFPAEDAAGFSAGAAASVMVDGSFETLPGVVREVSPVDTVMTGGRIVRTVTIEVTNPGAITAQTTASATVGAAGCAANATFENKTEKPVLVTTSGRITALRVKEGDQVSANQVLAVLSDQDVGDKIATAGDQVASANDAIDTAGDSIANAADQVRDARFTLDARMEALEDYNIRSPIEGTVVEKKYKQGDNIAEAGKELCTIYDLHFLRTIINVDELDIKKIREGQNVMITTDAIPGMVYEGVITRIGINGKTENGVTTYPVTVQVDDPGELLPAMNVNTTVVLSETPNVLAVPVSAVSRGNMVLVKTSDPDAAAAGNEEGLPEGYAYREVELGASNEDSIEILSGLSEGDEIAYIPAFDMSDIDFGASDF